MNSLKYKGYLMKKSIVLAIAALLSISVFAEPSLTPEKESIETNPKQCLTELKEDKSKAEEEKKKKEEPSWLAQLVKHHKLGSLHFQDIIEFFH